MKPASERDCETIYKIFKCRLNVKKNIVSKIQSLLKIELRCTGMTGNSEV